MCAILPEKPKNMSKKNVIFYANPKIDFLFGLYGGKPIPTKQDKFAPIEVTQINEDGAEEKLNKRWRENKGLGYNKSVPSDSDSTTWFLKFKFLKNKEINKTVLNQYKNHHHYQVIQMEYHCHFLWCLQHHPHALLHL